MEIHPGPPNHNLAVITSKRKVPSLPLSLPEKMLKNIFPPAH